MQMSHMLCDCLRLIYHCFMNFIPTSSFKLQPSSRKRWITDAHIWSVYYQMYQSAAPFIQISNIFSMFLKWLIKEMGLAFRRNLKTQYRLPSQYNLLQLSFLLGLNTWTCRRIQSNHIPVAILWRRTRLCYCIRENYNRLAASSAVPSRGLEKRRLQNISLHYSVVCFHFTK